MSSGRIPLWLTLAVVLMHGASGCEAPRGTPSVPSAGPAPAAPESPRAPAFGPTPAPSRVRAPELAGPQIFTLDEEQVGELLGTTRSVAPLLPERIISIARKFIGQPYQIYLLGEFPIEYYDVDPIYDLTHSDCVTFCETVYAMSLSDDWWSFLRTLQRLRYKDGQVGMLTRNHYTLADWDVNNSFLLEDLTTTLGGGSVAKPLVEVVNRAAFFKKFGLGQDVPVQRHEDHYIPTESVPSIEGELRNGDFVNIIRSSGGAGAMWAGHTGLIAIDENNRVNFLHSASPKVREQPLMEYLQSDKPCVGIKILRPRADAEARVKIALQTPLATPVGNGALRERLANSPLMSTGMPLWYAEDWADAMRLQAFELDYDTRVDPNLQVALESAESAIAEELGIPPGDRSIALLDLHERRFAAFQPDALFYGASVPKIAIVMAYFDKFPDAATNLDPHVQRELELVLKRSDNELAAKYSQIVGLDHIQKLLESKPYRFYDKEHGGGIWCGKHYGVAEPRIGDPIGDHSHAVTTRQCLRYMLMLEQGRLVSAEASATIKRLFSAPSLEFHDHNFITGLKGRRAVVLRKSGTWEEWHLDVARVQAEGRLYLIAGATRHARGQEYLARMAAAIDDALGAQPPPSPYRHRTVMHDQATDFIRGDLSGGHISADGRYVALTPADETSEAWYESEVITSAFPFSQAVLSMNVQTPAHTGARAELRVGRSADDFWSPWMFVLDWGDHRPMDERVLEFDRGKIDVDYFRSSERFDRLQYRIRAARCEDERATVCVRRVAVTYSEMTGLPISVDFPDPPQPPLDPALIHRRLDVPFRTQKVSDPNLSGQLCSPASTSMVTSYRGVEVRTEQMHPVVLDPWNNIFGNWPRNVQAAYSFGVPGYLARFSKWEDVERMIANDQPLILSIKAPERGVLRNTPYKATPGHLIVLTGFTPEGRVLINDPAVATPDRGLITVDRDELEAAWMRATGGLSYVLLPREAP